MTLQWTPGSAVNGHGPFEWTADFGDGVDLKISYGLVGYLLTLFVPTDTNSLGVWITFRHHATLEAAQDYAETVAPQLLRGLAERIEREGQE